MNVSKYGLSIGLIVSILTCLLVVQCGRKSRQVTGIVFRWSLVVYEICLVFAGFCFPEARDWNTHEWKTNKHDREVIRDLFTHSFLDLFKLVIMVLTVCWMTENSRLRNIAPKDTSNRTVSWVEGRLFSAVYLASSGIVYFSTSNASMILLYVVVGIWVSIWGLEFTEDIPDRSNSENRNIFKLSHWLHVVTECVMFTGSVGFVLIYYNGVSPYAIMFSFFLFVVMVAHFVYIWYFVITQSGRHVVLIVCQSVGIVMFLMLCHRLLINIYNGRDKMMIFASYANPQTRCSDQLSVDAGFGYTSKLSSPSCTLKGSGCEGDCVSFDFEKYQYVTIRISCVLLSYVVIIIARLFAGLWLGDCVRRDHSLPDEDDGQQSTSSQGDILKQARYFIKYSWNLKSGSGNALMQAFMFGLVWSMLLISYLLDFHLRLFYIALGLAMTLLSIVGLYRLREHVDTGTNEFCLTKPIMFICIFGLLLGKAFHIFTSINVLLSNTTECWSPLSSQTTAVSVVFEHGIGAVQAVLQVLLIRKAFRKDGRHPGGRFDIGHIAIQVPFLIAGNLGKCR